MNVGAMLGAGIGAGAPIGANAISAPGAAGAAATGASAEVPGATPQNGVLSPQMQNLLNLLQGFSSAEILIALMMMSGGDSGKKPHKSDDTLGALLGFALAQQVNQIVGQLLASLPGMQGVAGAQGGGVTGGMLNVQA